MDAKSYDPGAINTPFFKLFITHLPTDTTISFNGWVIQFSDDFISNWNTETVYGRMDPLATFQNTQRQISMTFDVVSGDLDQAKTNLKNVNRLIEFLYPVYESGERGVQNTLKASPLIGMRWTNLVASTLDGKRLVGFLSGVTYAPDMGPGGFIEASNQAGLYIPKTLSISLNYTVLHTHLVGWYDGNQLAEGEMGPAGAPEYIFGGDNINSEFPNAFDTNPYDPTLINAEELGPTEAPAAEEIVQSQQDEITG